MTKYEEKNVSRDLIKWWGELYMEQASGIFQQREETVYKTLPHRNKVEAR